MCDLTDGDGGRDCQGPSAATTAVEAALGGLDCCGLRHCTMCAGARPDVTHHERRSGRGCSWGVNRQGHGQSAPKGGVLVDRRGSGSPGARQREVEPYRENWPCKQTAGSKDHGVHRVHGPVGVQVPAQGAPHPSRSAVIRQKVVPCPLLSPGPSDDAQDKSRYQSDHRNDGHKGSQVPGFHVILRKG